MIDRDSSEPTATFAAALRTARHALALSLEELAEASGVSVRALSDMERGRALGPQRRTVAQIADALKLDGAPREAFLALAKAGRTRSVHLAVATGLCELPGSVGDFTGRAAELAWITRVVYRQPGAPGQSGTAVISGGAGLGKTSLVVRAAHSLRDTFAGGVHFVDAAGMGIRPLGSDEILSRVLRALGVREQQIPQETDERAGLYRQLLRDRRVLVIVDDAASEAQVRLLLPGAGASQLLVTSRRLLAGLEGVQRLHLDPMPDVDAYDMLWRIVAERGDAPRPQELQTLVEMLGGLPLALRIAGNRLVAQPHWTVADLVGRLSSSQRRLDQLTAGDLKIAAAFAMSYEQLPDGARDVFRAASVAPGLDFSALLTAVIAQTALADTEDQLDDLVDLGLLEAAAGGRYRFHDLVRLYAHQRLERDNSAAEVAAARRRMVTWLLTTLRTAGQWFEPRGEHATFASAEDADAWIRVEAEHWFPALGAAALAGDHDLVVAAVAALHWFSDRWLHWQQWRDVFQLGHDSAVYLGDLGLQAEFLNYVAWTFTLPWRDIRPALDYAGKALDLARAAGDTLQEAWSLDYLASAHYKLGDLPAARTCAMAAAELFDKLGDIDASCQSWISRGLIARRLGDAEEALTCYAHAHRLAEDPTSGMTPIIADNTLPIVLSRIAQVLGDTGRTDEGLPLMLRAVDLLDGAHNRYQQATILWMLADLYLPDEPEQACQALLRAAEVFESIGENERTAECRQKATAISADGAS
ncbi:helix-turn-helix domain-containing protein [Micromonospora sp. NPDC004551]|uniref:helix-turn-helix domain-containing protein n=1 Tax=Micromonospora sp. NPDC004551 TaxID=3154284 RepID=UPI0033A27B70